MKRFCLSLLFLVLYGRVLTIYHLMFFLCKKCLDWELAHAFCFVLAKYFKKQYSPALGLRFKNKKQEDFLKSIFLVTKKSKYKENRK